MTKFEGAIGASDTTGHADDGNIVLTYSRHV